MNILDLKEKREHGTESFPVVLYKHDTNIPYQWHNEEEIIYVLDGEAEYNINGEKLVVEKGDCAYCAGGKLHSMFLGENQRVSLNAVLFDRSYLFAHGDVCTGILDRKILIKNHFSKAKPKEREVIETVRGICDALTDKRFGYEIEVKTLISQFYNIIIRNGLYETRTKELDIDDNKNVINAIGYIHANYTRKIAIDELAAITGYSVPYFESFFKKYTGKSPIDYIILYRLKKACEMLLKTDGTVLDIAYSCGFSNVSYFIRRFKEAYGITPLKYKTQSKLGFVK
ncbi:MAG: AraC family transcriptional regulator [Clostridiales bacterium]|nr:AraC family transcriptional regulator [Clostridiales bacterium]